MTIRVDLSFGKTISVANAASLSASCVFPVMLQIMKELPDADSAVLSPRPRMQWYLFRLLLAIFASSHRRTKHIAYADICYTVATSVSCIPARVWTVSPSRIWFGRCAIFYFQAFKLNAYFLTPDVRPQL
jgi:hypothetical protein